MESGTGVDVKLRRALCNLPKDFNNRYTEAAHHGLLDILFRSLTDDNAAYLSQLFPSGYPPSKSLQEVQGALEEPEYTEAARGHPCGHILKNGEATYRCTTCTDDPTVVLCSRCWSASDHEGHQYQIDISGGNSGCCDCGDQEAFKRQVHCAIHTARENLGNRDDPSHNVQLPPALLAAARSTIARVLDYFCDVISCSPDNLKLAHTFESVTNDERSSRLSPSVYLIDEEQESNPEYALIIWNDEKHTMDEVCAQVARACKERKNFGVRKAEEANELGRSVVCHSRNLQDLLRRAKIIEQIKVTVSVRSAKDTFREQMCGTILDWLRDIAGASFFGHHSILRQLICEEMLGLWNVGSQASNALVGRRGLFDDEATEEPMIRSRLYPDAIQILFERHNQTVVAAGADEADDDDDQDEDISDAGQGNVIVIEHDEGIASDTTMHDDISLLGFTESDVRSTDIVSLVDEMDTDNDGEFMDASERLDPTPATRQLPPRTAFNPTRTINTDQMSTMLSQGQNVNYRNIPLTPRASAATASRRLATDPTHWKVAPDTKGKTVEGSTPVWEDVRKNIRLDSLILFDLRLWKKLRIGLRNLLISTMIKIPDFKRILGLRFAGVYNTLAQLYLIADREPELSILHLSVQILTTPSIAEEVIRKANFLTNLMAILYTFLTTRQVGWPEEVNVDLSLGFEAGSVSNRRLYQFFSDLRWFLAAASIKEHIKLEKQYLMQYLDLAKLSQGICPNIRAVGDHVEYEADTWISASLLTREINNLCRQLSEAYNSPRTESNIDPSLSDAIRQATATAMLVSSGLDRHRFEQSEVKGPVRFHRVGPFSSLQPSFKTVDYDVAHGTLSFHHPLHYTLSWLLENAKHSFQAIQILRDTANELVERFDANSQVHQPSKQNALFETGEDALLTLFDYPLRVCAWLAQMKANLWVRNGMSLRHQMNQYKSVSHRNVGHHRDLFMVQTAFVACTPQRVLASAIDRFALVPWMNGQFRGGISEIEPHQVVDIAEEFFHLLINVLSDRDHLCEAYDDVETQMRILRKDIAHILCFKPLSYSDLTNRLTEKAQDDEHLQSLLDEMTTFRAPEGLFDSGVFELKPEYLQELDPYNSHFSKNQRDEAENIYKKWMARKLNKSADDIVLEPKLNAITSKAFAGLCAVVHTPLFATCIYHTLAHLISRNDEGPRVKPSRAESFMQVVLHLTLIATLEDVAADAGTAEHGTTFIHNALSMRLGANGSTMVDVLHQIWLLDDFTTSRSKIRHILRIFQRQWPELFARATAHIDFPSARLDSASPAAVEADLEAKKKQAAERKARIMAQMQQQQQSFLNNQGMSDWDDDDVSDTESEIPLSTEKRSWKFPSGVCIQCREDTNDDRYYGTFAMISDGHVLRQTPQNNLDFVNEVLSCPENLDESNEESRPFGVSGNNIEQVEQLNNDGFTMINSRRVLSKGWPKESTLKEPTSTSCGHIMHFSCFETYYTSVRRRHEQQIARRQPERISQNEYVCPLCKALANTFLPVVFKASDQSYPGILQTESSFDMFVEENLSSMSKVSAALEAESQLEAHLFRRESQLHMETVSSFTTNAVSAFAKAIGEAEASASSDVASRTFAGKEALIDLANVYVRLGETLYLAAHDSVVDRGSVKQTFSTLLKVVTHSVETVEIGHRGRFSSGSTFIDGISSQTLSHLQVLCYSVRPYAATVVMMRSNLDANESPYRATLHDMLSKLFPGEMNQQRTPLLLQDGFATFVEQSMIMAPMQGLPVAHFLRLCLIQELIRVAVWWIRIKPNDKSDKETQGEPIRNAGLSKDEYRSMGGFVFWLTSALPSDSSSLLFPVHQVEPLYKALRTYALAFMRKAVLFLHVAQGIDFPSTPAIADKSELDKLLAFTQLPDLVTILGGFSEFTEARALPKLADSWVKAWGRPSENRTLIRLMHPVPFELIGLPQYYDLLLEECQKRKCPTTGKELTDPALCLFCGDIFCAQAWCCMKDKQRGGCNYHIEQCSAPVGAYLFIRKCNVVLLDVHRVGKQPPAQVSSDSQEPDVNVQGSFFPAPYLTKHGETDQGLRMKHRLLLNQKRYDKLVRDVWLMLNGNIWSAIARKLEGDVNVGGWETL